MTALQSMLGEAARAGRIESHRLGGVKLPEYQPAVPFNFPTHAQFTKLASGLPPELQPAVWIMRGYGLRPGECLGLRKEDFSGGLPAGVPPAGGQWQRRPGAAQGAQAGEFRDVPLPGYVKAVVDGLGDGDLFAISTRGFNKAFAKAAKVAGLDGFRPHDLSLSFNPCVRVGP
jgi:integrase